MIIKSFKIIILINQKNETMKKLTTFLLFLFLSINIVYSQEKFEDQLVKRDGTIIKCKIKEIGDDEIKFNQEGISTDVLIGIDKSKVTKIIFADGKEFVIDNIMSTYEDLNSQHKNNLKFNLFMPITGGYALTYERSLKPARSIEAEIGLIAKGANNEMDMPEAHGLFIKAGYKMMRSPDYYIRGMKYAHILKGGYVKPEIAFASFSYNKHWDMPNQGESESGSTTKVALLVNVGKQVIYSNAFAIDFFVGAGYGFGKLDSDLHYYAFFGTSGDVTFVMSGGLRVGFLF